MAKKTKKTDRPTGEKAARWTVRGVPARLQKAAGDAARARGKTLGQWLSAVVEAAVAEEPEAAPAAGWRETIETRVARLESLLTASRDKPAPQPAARRGAAESAATA